MDNRARCWDGPRWAARHEPDSGFSLLEVIVALAVLTVALLGIARVLGSATVFAAAGRQARLASAAATALSATLSENTLYPEGWICVGGVGVDGVPGTAGDVPAQGSHCRRRVTALTRGDVQWWWVEVRCGPRSAPGDGSGDEPGQEPLPGARAGLLVGR